MGLTNLGSQQNWEKHFLGYKREGGGRLLNTKKSDFQILYSR